MKGSFFNIKLPKLHLFKYTYISLLLYFFIVDLLFSLYEREIKQQF
jgi:hypothetical protein